MTDETVFDWELASSIRDHLAECARLCREALASE